MNRIMKFLAVVGVSAAMVTPALAFGPVTFQAEGQHGGLSQGQVHTGSPGVVVQGLSVHQYQHQSGPAGYQSQGQGSKAYELSAGGGTSVQHQSAGGSQFQIQVRPGSLNVE